MVVKLQSMGTAWAMRTGDALGAKGNDDCSITGGLKWTGIDECSKESRQSK
jgi:hypothetical protein